MEQAKWGIEMVKFMQNSFQNSMLMLEMTIEQWQKMLGAYIDQFSSSHGENRKLLDQWLDMARKGREEYKKTMDENFDRLAEIFKGAKK